MIAQDFGFTRDFLKERNNSTYCRLKKIPCGFKEQARARHPGEKCGLSFTHHQFIVGTQDTRQKFTHRVNPGHMAQVFMHQ